MEMGTKVDGRGVSRNVVRKSDRMGTAPKSATNTPRGLTTTESSTPIGGAGMDSTDQRRRLAAEYLTRAADDYERAARTRIAYAITARQHGLTNADIGTFLGITEGAVRKLIARHGGAE